MISLDGSKPKKIAFIAFLLSADTTNDICNCNISKNWLQNN